MKKRRLIGFISTLVALAGVVSAVAAIARIENYLHWVGLVLVSGSIGLATGLRVSKIFDAWQVRALISHLREEKFSGKVAVAFIGFGLLLGTVVNEKLSTPKLLDTIVEEKVISHGYKGRINHCIVVNLNDSQEELDCSLNYWKSLSYKAHIKVQYFDSPFGCDFVKLPGDQWK